MSNVVNKIPSLNLPLTNESGLIHPIWYEYFRSFIAGVDASGGGGTVENKVNAGAGIVGSGLVSTVNVGAGDGLSVSADAVSVNITGQVNAQAAPEDEILISDASDLSRIRKTSLRDVAALSVANPGGNSTNIQYNDSGAFAGNSLLTTDGSGYVVCRYLTLSNPSGGQCHLRLADSGFGSRIYWASTVGTGTELPTSYYIGGTGGTPQIVGQSTSYALTTLNNGFQFEVSTGKTLSIIDSGIAIVGLNLRRSAVAGITASTTQTQGNGALTNDINEVSTVANANDTVTLMAALAGRSVLVINNGANTLRVFPSASNNLGAGVNTATTIAAGSKKLFVSYANSIWYQVV